jgi:hypothetical protein
MLAKEEIYSQVLTISEIGPFGVIVPLRWFALLV